MHGLLRALFDAVNLADRLQDRLGAFFGVERDFFGQTRRLVRVRLDLIDRDVHLVHRRRRLFGRERERVDVLGDLFDRVRHLFDRRDRLADATGELTDVFGDLVVGRGHLEDRRARLFRARSQRVGVRGDVLDRRREIAREAGRLVDAPEVAAHAVFEPANGVVDVRARLAVEPAATLARVIDRDRRDRADGEERDADVGARVQGERHPRRPEQDADDAQQDTRRHHVRAYGTRASGACARRDIAVSMATALSSMPTKRRPSFSATASVVPLPA